MLSKDVDPVLYDAVAQHLKDMERNKSRWDVFMALLFLAALPWLFSAGISYFMLAWRTIP